MNKIPISRNSAAFIKKATTTSKAKKTESKYKLLNLENDTHFKFSIVAPQTTKAIPISTAIQLHGSSSRKSINSGHFKFPDCEKENMKLNNIKCDIEKRSDNHLFDSVNKLEVDNKVKSSMLEDVILRLLETEGELWQIKSKSQYVDTTSITYDTLPYDSPYNKSKYAKANKLQK